MSGYLFEGRNLEIFCVETQTAQLGQTCPAFTPGACLPNRATDTPDGGLSTTFLTCDQATSKCVAADGPPLVDFGASCFNRYTPVAPGTGYTYVQACPKQYCLRLVDEADGCTRSGCTAACWGDHMCPLGWYCDDSLTNLSVGHISSSPVCRPGPRNVVPKTWACLPADGGVD
jgi:hypothetical protein